MFKSIKLKKENKRLIRLDEGSRKEVKLQADKINQLGGDVGNLTHANQILENKLAVSKAKLRDQVAADLLLESFKLIHRLIRGEKPTKTELSDYAGQQQRLAQMMAAQQGPYTDISGINQTAEKIRCLDIYIWKCLDNY